MSSKKILAFGASNSVRSINKKFAHYTASQFPNAEVVAIDLNDFEMPIFSIDREKESGIPPLAHDFKSLIRESDGIIISFAEHNGTYSAAFKNIYDWISRFGKPIWEDKPMFLQSTSPGGRGGKSVMEHALENLPRRNANIIARFSLPSFKENFSETEGISDPELKVEFQRQLGIFIDEIGN